MTVVTILQVYNAVYIETGRNKNLAQYNPAFYEQNLEDFEKLKKAGSKYTRTQTTNQNRKSQ